MSWSPTGYAPIPMPPRPGDHSVKLRSAVEGRTPKQSLAKVDLEFEFDDGFIQTFTLIFGLYDWLDRHHSKLMDDLFDIAGVSQGNRHDISGLPRALQAKDLGVELEADRSPKSRTGVRLRDVFVWDPPEESTFK